MRKLPLGLLLGWVLIAGTAQAQVMRCVDAKTGEVTYTNGRCISGEMSTQIQAAQSAEEIAAERANASQARERSKAQMARAKPSAASVKSRSARNARPPREPRPVPIWKTRPPAARPRALQRHTGRSQPRSSHLG
jgi:hypothetical protein